VIAEAVQRPTMKFVATQTADRLDLQALHRVRARLAGERIGIINQIRAFPRLSGGARHRRESHSGDLARSAAIGLATLQRIEQNEGVVKGNFSTVLKIYTKSHWCPVNL
jgi:transposase